MHTAWATTLSTSMGIELYATWSMAAPSRDTRPSALVSEPGCRSESSLLPALARIAASSSTWLISGLRDGSEVGPQSPIPGTDHRLPCLDRSGRRGWPDPLCAALYEIPVLAGWGGAGGPHRTAGSYAARYSAAEEGGWIMSKRGVIYPVL